MTKRYYVRKNNIVQLKHIPATSKREEAREWLRPKVGSEGWIRYETVQAVEQLDEELKLGLLTEIPSKYFDKNREKWLEVKKKDKEGEEEI